MPMMPIPFSAQNAIEPMQLDAQEENENIEQQIIVENPTLDLESYANAYTGQPKLYRLLFIADVCPSYRLEALKIAIAHVMTTYNVTMYQVLFKKLNDSIGYTGRNNNACMPSSSCLPDIAAQSSNMAFGMAISGAASPTPSNAAATVSANVTNNAHDLPVYDSNWVEAKSKKAALKLEKLDSDLKNYKSNSIKESIRRGHDDLGDHYLNCGDLSNALKCYSRARDYCTSGKHVVNMCLNVIKVSLYLQNWSHVLSYVAKAESTPDFAEGTKDGNMAIFTRLKCAAGIAELQMKKYKAAAKHFLLCHFDHCEYPEMLSPNNVAIYGGLCALASFDRSELQRLVIGSSSFKLFLELEPQLRDIIFKFYESKYASCLTMLNEMRDNLLLDMYIAPHINSIYTQIRNRALVQYFSPYLSADMNKMADAFNVNVAQLENEIMHLVLDGQIQARIDSHSKILYRKECDQRSSTFDRALDMGKQYQRRARMLVVRAAMQKANIYVKSADISVAPGSSMTANNARN